MAVIAQFPERIQIGQWDDGRFAGPFDADMKNGRPDLTTAEYVRADLHRGAVEALDEFRDGLTDALNAHGVPAMASWREAIDYLAKHGGQSE